MSKIGDWKVGDKGCIVSNEHSHSKFSVGDIVIITSIEDDFVWCKNVNNETGCADFRDIERIGMIGESKYKYRICDILGVDVGQEFCVKYRNGNVRIFVNEDGYIDSQFENQYDIDEVAIYAINHPESIKICPNEEDKEYAKKIYDVFGRDGTIIRDVEGLRFRTYYGHEINIVDSGFKNLKLGDKIMLSDLIDIS